jgi:peptidoglycan DL-endopeptidase CwlO
MRALAFTIGLVVLTSACASSGFSRPPASSPPRPPTPTAGPAAGERGLPALVGHRIAADALALRGTPYRNGGTDPRGFDCSGLVAYVFAKHGLAVPRQTGAQFAVGDAVAADRLQPGDLLFFSTVAPGASHVGIAIDDDEFVHAPSSRGVVRVERLALPYWRTRFVGAKRIRAR